MFYIYVYCNNGIFFHLPYFIVYLVLNITNWASSAGPASHIIPSGGCSVYICCSLRGAAVGGGSLESRKSKQSMWCTPWMAVRRKALNFLLPFAGSNLKEGEKYGALAALLLHFLAHNMYARRVWRGIKAAHFKELLKDEDY